MQTICAITTQNTEECDNAFQSGKYETNGQYLEQKLKW